MKHIIRKSIATLIGFFYSMHSYAYSDKAYNDALNDIGPRTVRSGEDLLIPGIISVAIMFFVARGQVNKGESPVWFGLPIAVMVLFVIAVLL